MLKLLLKKQAQEWASFLYLSAAGGRRRSRAAIIGYAALLLYAAAAFGAMFWLLSDTLCAALEPAGLSWLYFALMGTLALLLGLIGSALMTYPTLYAARDNEFLLSLPIPPGTILLARMTGLYLLTLFFQVLVLLPAGIVYARYAGLTAGGAASWLVALGLLTLLTLALACAVGWLIALAAGHVRHRSLVTVLLSTVFIVAYFALCMRLNRSLALLMEHLDLLARYFAGWLRPLGLIGRALSGDGAALRLGAVQAVLLILLTLAFVFFGAQTGLLWGLRLPNLTWTNETAPIKQGAATALALLTGWAAVLLLAGGYILLHGRLAPEGILALAAALLTIVNVLLRRRLQTVGTARFASLQP